MHYTSAVARHLLKDLSPASICAVTGTPDTCPSFVSEKFHGADTETPPKKKKKKHKKMVAKKKAKCNNKHKTSQLANRVLKYKAATCQRIRILHLPKEHQQLQLKELSPVCSKWPGPSQQQPHARRPRSDLVYVFVYVQIYLRQEDCLIDIAMKTTFVDLHRSAGYSLHLLSMSFYLLLFVKTKVMNPCQENFYEPLSK